MSAFLKAHELTRQALANLMVAVQKTGAEVEGGSRAYAEGGNVYLEIYARMATTLRSSSQTALSAPSEILNRTS